jgi:CRISPR-associated endonuclease/helicase Cas3
VRTFDAPTGSARSLTISWVDGQVGGAGTHTALGTALKDALTDGGCVAVICNTVARAQQMYQALQGHFASDELDLLHARFPFEERERREKRVLAQFAKPGGSVIDENGSVVPVERPYRSVLVATQLIEQSLDLDFDLMVTDLAPADLLLQRAGRLHRHERPARPARLDQPQLWICRPERWTNDVPRFSPSQRAVYHAHALLRTWLALDGRSHVRIPDDMDELIEAVYGTVELASGTSSELRAYLEETADAYAATIEHDRDEAHKRWLLQPRHNGFFWDFTSGAREEDAPEFHPEHQALTRLIDPTASIVCLYGPREHPTFDAAGREPVPSGNPPSLALAKRLLRRAVTISDARVVHQLLDRSPPASWLRSALLQHHRLMLFGPDGAALEPLGKYRLNLDPELGIRLDAIDREEEE